MPSSSLGGQRKSTGHQLVLDLAAGRGDDGQQLPLAQLHELQVLDDVAVGAGRLDHHRQVRQLAQQARRPLHHVRHVAASAASRPRMSSFSLVVRLRTRSSMST